MDKLNILCTHFPLCSGCTVNDDVEKIQTIQDAKKFFSDLEINDFTLTIGPPCEWRCRAKLAIRGTTQEPLIGLFQARSHHVIKIPLCRVHHPLINQAVDYLHEWIMCYNILPYDEKTGKGMLRYVELAVDRKNQKIQLALIINQNQQEFISQNELNNQIEKLWNQYPFFWHSIWVNFNQRRDNVILGENWLHLQGNLWLWDRFCEREICFHPASFAQANPDMFERLLVKLKEFVPSESHVVEFYAGGGVIGLSILDKCKRLVCNEIVPLAQICFEQSQKLLPNELKNKISFVCGPAEKQFTLLDSEVDIVIVDPPRKGIDHELFNRLYLHPTLKRLIYVSCGWKSFQNDCQNLIKGRWKLTFAEGFLFFPGSNHLEILAVFDKIE